MPHATLHGTLEIIVDVEASFDPEDCEPQDAILSGSNSPAFPPRS